MKLYLLNVSCFFLWHNGFVMCVLVEHREVFPMKFELSPNERWPIGYRDPWVVTVFHYLCHFVDYGFWMTMDDYGWMWMIMDDYGWLWMIMDECGWLCVIMDDCGDCGWLWIIVDDYGWLWLSKEVWKSKVPCYGCLHLKSMTATAKNS